MDFIKRYVALLIDSFSAMMFLFILMFFLGFFNILEDVPDLWMEMIAGFLFYKDCFDGKSIGKRILKLQVIDCKTGQAASPLKCFVRNLSYLLNLFDLLPMFYHFHGRRLGDYITNTCVIEYDNKKPQTKWLEAISIVIGVNLLIIILSMLIPRYSTALGLYGLLYS